MHTNNNGFVLVRWTKKDANKHKMLSFHKRVNTKRHAKENKSKTD